jgi:M-phase inducer tyrosine phosphatase
VHLRLVILKRLRRPVLSALVEPCDQQTRSAYPVLCSAFEDSSPRGSAPVHRAFSALLPPSMHAEPEEDEPSFNSQDMSSPAQVYSRRQHAKTIRRCDGTEDFWPITGVTAMTTRIMHLHAGKTSTNSARRGLVATSHTSNTLSLDPH